MRFPLHPVYSVQNGAADRFIISPEVPFFNSRTEDFGVPASNRVCAGIRCGAGSLSRAGQSFFLYEKSVERESDFLRGRRPKVCTDLTPPLFRPSKALQIMGIQGESLPDAPPAAHLRIRRSRIPRYVVSRRTAERETASRGLASRRVLRGNKEKEQSFMDCSFCKRDGVCLSSQAVASQVFSTQVSLTSVFGMGTGGSSPPSTPSCAFALRVS